MIPSVSDPRLHAAFIALEYPLAGSGGGVGHFVQTLARSLVASGCAVTVLALQHEAGAELDCEDQGVRLVWLKPLHFHWRVARIPWLGPRLALFCRELERSWIVWRGLAREHARHPIGIVEVTEQAGFFPVLFFKGAPIIARLHGERYTIDKHTPGLGARTGVRLSRKLQRAALRRVRCMIAPSQAHAREIEAELGNISTPIMVIPNMFILPEEAADRQPGLPSGAGERPMVLYVGRLDRRKGVGLLLEAAKLLQPQIPALRFILTGAAPGSTAEEDLIREISRLELQDTIYLAGYCARQALNDLYRSASICVVPSYYETFGLVALEAMAFGVPVVAADCGALPEIVRAGVTGLIFPAGNGAALAGCLRRLLEDPVLRRSMGNAGAVRARIDFAPQDILARNLSLLQQVARMAGRAG